jgi:hypothetical protein
MASPHDDTHHGDAQTGTMDITVQEKTFDGFMRMVTRGAIVIIALLIFLALVNG